jgi:type VI secretion system protein VasJ
MPIDFQALLQPISAEHPAGEDCRMGADYTSIATEVDKLTRAKDVGAPDWEKIETLSTEVLTQQAKDFLVAGWLASAWLEKQGLDGLLAGLSLFNGLFDKFWDASFPPLNRIRGRRNAIIWWNDRANLFLSSGTLSPITQELFDGLNQGANALDKNLADKDPDAPSLGDFIRALNSLTVISQPSPAADPVVSADPSSNADSAPNSNDNTANTSGASLASAPANLKGAATLNTLDDVENALSSVQPYIGDVAQVLTKLDPYNPLSVRLIRFAARGAILALPPATAGATLIPEPPPSEIEMLQSVSAGTNPQATIEFCEARITQYPFWLDLDHQSAQAYSALGTPAVAMQEAVIDEILAFVKRLPGIESLTFGGQKTPFADAATQSWLTDCINQRSGGGGSDSLAVSKKAASQSLGAGQVEAAIGIFQAYIDNTRGARDQFRARLELLEMVLGVKKEADLVPFLAPLIQECQTRKIAEWEPALALAAWNLKLQALHQASKIVDATATPEKLVKYQEEINEALQQISMLSFVDAARQI